MLRGLARVSVGPGARGGQESGPVRLPPGVSPAVGGAPWRLAGGSRGGRVRIGGGVDVGPAGRTGRDCALSPYIRKASQTLLSGSRGLVCELVSGGREGDGARKLFHVNELRLWKEYSFAGDSKQDIK